MKKKILSLLVAGVVALGTAMPASATDKKVITGQAGQTETTANVTVTGTVMDSQNTDQSGRIYVEMPTTMAFTVYADGNTHAAPFTIDNKGSEPVNVSVESFSETISNGGITLVATEGELSSKDRSHVHLTLRGEQGNVVLKSTGTDKTKLATIQNGASGTINLDVKAGTGDEKTDSGQDVDTDGANETFNLVFKISK